MPWYREKSILAEDLRGLPFGIGWGHSYKIAGSILMDNTKAYLERLAETYSGCPEFFKIMEKRLSKDKYNRLIECLRVYKELYGE